MGTMNKKELVIKSASACGIKQKLAFELIDAFLGHISETLQSNNEVSIKNFGTFKNVRVPARKGFNPRTKEKIVIPEKTKVVFKPSTRLQVYNEIHKQ